MSRGKQCPARAVIFIDGDKAKVRCDRHADYHHDQEIADRDFKIVALPHYVRFADGQSVTVRSSGPDTSIGRAQRVNDAHDHPGRSLGVPVVAATVALLIRSFRGDELLRGR